MSHNQKLRVLAIYLPQFHRVRENDLWWGAGFTDWIAVKKGVPLFAGHKQPKVPLGNNYYNLSDINIMEWQADLAKKYKIDGFCFYHYWFENGRKILEKPAENLLNHPNVNMPFCFSWPTVSWACTWSKLIVKESWAEEFQQDKNIVNNNDGILLRQRFGNESDWRIHFEYLLGFFKDPRYIKVNEKPVFIFYDAVNIPCLDRMILYWRKLAKEHGIPGLYIVTGGGYSKLADASYDHMGYNGFGSVKFMGEASVKTYSYDEAWESYLAKPVPKNHKVLWSGMVDFDDTPRHGMNGSVLMGFSIEKFAKYFSLLVKKSQANKNPFVFINAWNEWGENMHLEPDEEYGYKILETVRNTMETCQNVNCDYYLKNNVSFLVDALETERDRLYIFYNLFKQWTLLKSHPEKLKLYFLSHNYKKVAVYGFGEHGKILLKELIRNGIDVLFLIDRNTLIKNEEIDIYSPESDLPSCDVIIVSVVDKYDEIVYDLQKVNCPIISLYEVIREAQEYDTEISGA